ncbi:Protein of unknown function [Evansella caseinilytica]|uniref:DUF2663 family protein n=1 Tax=Evansella caseinilytica TaxID=1503961 RepID=A0A1H3V287_9BACI|nr:DUF2663 family protein [Evansella caseinilytica]SDZ68820.1 Protein of unknown function [Evansella caseinilytica]
MSDRSMQTNVQAYHEVVVKALIEAKQKEVKAEKKLIQAGICFIFVLIIGCGYLFYQLTVHGVGSSFLSFLLSDIYILSWLAALFITYKLFEAKSKKFEKAENDFDELKEDIIDRSSDIWHTAQLEEIRMHQYHDLKTKHDINLYHK